LPIILKKTDSPRTASL